MLILFCVRLPVALSEFYLTVLCEALVMSMLALSFNLLFGYMGQLSFGQAAFYGLGGYAVAMLLTKAPLQLLAQPGRRRPSGQPSSAPIVGYFLRPPAEGIYFAVLTLAFGQLIFFIVFKWHNFTGGDDGIQGVFSLLPT